VQFNALTAQCYFSSLQTNCGLVTLILDLDLKKTQLYAIKYMTLRHRCGIKALTFYDTIMFSKLWADPGWMQKSTKWVDILHCSY